MATTAQHSASSKLCLTEHRQTFNSAAPTFTSGHQAGLSQVLTSAPTSPEPFPGHLGPDSQSTYADVSRDTPHKCKCAPSYLCAVPTELDTPENRLLPTDVTFLRWRILGAYLRWTYLALPLIFYSHMQMREIRRFTNVLAPGA